MYVEGKLKTRKWTDKEGQERLTTEINCDQLVLLGSRSGGGGGEGYEGESYGGGASGGGKPAGGYRSGGASKPAPAASGGSTRSAPAPRGVDTLPDDDIPF